MDVTLQLEGFEPRTFELDKEFNKTSILNIFFWPGFLIDALTGALFKYDKTTYTVNMSNGTISLRLEDVRRGPDGQYLLPETDAPIHVIDSSTGLTVTFK